MKVCIPTIDDDGLGSHVAGHFGRASFFAILDTDGGACEILANPRSPTRHGECHHTPMLSKLGVRVVACPGIGKRAAHDLEREGISVLRVVAPTVADVMSRLRDGDERPVSPDDCCPGHHW
jgi:predicted Fe-Mo cluster-binding NifX family protein